MMDCIFCKIIAGSIPSERVLEDDGFVAIRDIHPKSAIHVLVMPRAHVRSLNDVAGWHDDATGQRLLEFVVRVAGMLGIRDSGYRVITNAGPDSGQEVDHLHLHVMGGERLGDFH
jgi:histidine triad (HIT) family protein